VPFHWATGAVESARLELASPGCRPGILPLNYDPAGREGIEPSLRVLEARLVTMTLRPKNGDKCAKRFHCPQAGPPPCAADGARKRRHGGGGWTRTDVLLTAFAERLVRELNPSHSIDSGAATPVASRGMISCVPGRARTCMIRFRKPAPLPFGHEDERGVTYGNRTRLRRFTADPHPRRATSPCCCVRGRRGGLSWTRTTFFRASTGRYHSTSSQPLVLPAGFEPDALRLKAGDPDR
jgi:hypothetical protein